MTSPLDPEPSTARANNAERSLGDNPATTSSQRNCLAEPAGADRTSRTNDGHPPSPSHRTCARPSCSANAATSASVKASMSPLTSTTCPLARRRATGIGTGSRLDKHEVRMWWQPCRKLAHELFTGGHRRELVKVVEEDADIDGSGRVQRLQDVIEGTVTLGGDPEGGEDRQRQAAGILVARLTGHPRIDAPCCRLVGPDRLGECRRLAKAGTSHHERDGLVEPRGQQFEQAWPNKFTLQRGRRQRRTTPARRREDPDHRDLPYASSRSSDPARRCQAPSVNTDAPSPTLVVAEAGVVGIQHTLHRQTPPDVGRAGSWSAGCGESRTSGPARWRPVTGRTVAGSPSLRSDQGCSTASGGSSPRQAERE